MPMPPLEGCELETYRCTRCRAHGVRLFRQYQTFADSISLLCQACAVLDQDKEDSIEIKDNTSQIGWLVAAVPSPGGELRINGEPTGIHQGQTFWGYTAIPKEGCDWWFALPVKL